MKKINNILIGMVILISSIFLVSAVDWSPQGDINLKDRFSIFNGVNATFTNFIGDGSQLTGISGADNSSWNETYANTLYVELSGDNMTGTLFANNITPTLNDTYSLGTPDLLWKDIYLGPGSIYLGNYILDIDGENFRIRNDTTDLMYFNTTSSEMVFTTNTRTMGFSRGASPLKLEEGIQFFDEDGSKHYSIYHAHGDEEWINVPSIFEDSIIFELEEEENLYGMEWVIWDETDQRPHLIVNHGETGRASIFDRSVQIGKELGVGALDENYTKCEGFNLIDCDTSSTGADLGVEDDIEAKGSILAQGNITATYFIGDGSQLTGISGGEGANDTIWNITGSNYLINSSGVLEVNETKLNETINALENDTFYYAGEIYIYNNGSNYFFFNETRLNETIDSRGNGNTYLNLSGTNANQDINISPYNLQTGNITANYGFFSWLGSLANRITKLWVGEINATGNIQTEANVTANYFIGDGSQLTGVNIITESTGLIQGGAVSVNGVDNTLIDISAGSGQIVDSTSDSNNPTLTSVTWDAKTGYNLTTMPDPDDTVAIYLALDSGGNVVEREVLPTAEERRDTIDLGIAARIDNGIIVFAGSGPTNVVHNPGAQTQDFMEAWGAFNIDGNRIQPYASGLQFTKTEGEIFRNGVSFQTNPKEPHVNLLTEQAPVSPFNYKLGDGTDVNLSSNQLDPENYDDGTSTLATVDNDDWTIQYISVFATGIVEVLYGQETFAKEEDAIVAIPNMDFIIPDDSANAIPLAYVILQQGDTVVGEDRFYRITRGGTGGGGGISYTAGDGLILDGGTGTTFLLNTTYTDTLYLAVGYTSLSNFSDNILWTSEFNSTGDTRWGGGADTIWDITGAKYLINNSDILNINETVLNSTIISVTGWDDGVGPLSIKWGGSTIANGSRATAWGDETTASQWRSTAWGYKTLSSAIDSTAWGWDTSATGQQSTAWGENTISSGSESTAWGYGTTASNNQATAWGLSTTASGAYSTAFGRNIDVSGENSVGIGLDSTARDLTQANTMAIMGGNVGIGTTSPSAKFEVNGNVKIEDDLNMTSNNITAVDCIVFKSGGRICDSP